MNCLLTIVKAILLNGIMINDVYNILWAIMKTWNDWFNLMTVLDVFVIKWILFFLNKWIDGGFQPILTAWSHWKTIKFIIPNFKIMNKLNYISQLEITI